MAIQRENYGYLPQLFTFDRNACVPTATANIMAALARTYPSLRSLISSNGDVTYQDLAATRDTLATDYFYTSKNWEPTGSPASLVIKGLQSYVAGRNLAQALEVEAIGPELGSREVEKIGNFGITEKAVSIESPSRGRLEKTVTTPSISDPIIQRSYRGGGVTIQDIQQALDNGDGLLLGLIYDGQLAGHGVSAVSLDWTDRNGNGRADAKEDATLTIVDPLNPSENYSQATPGSVDNEQRLDPLVEALGPVRTTEMRLISSNRDKKVRFEYTQYSVTYDEQTGEPGKAAGDSSNNITDRITTGLITFAAILTARSIKRDVLTGTSDDNVIELDPGRQRIKGGKGSDAFVIGDLDSLQEGQSDVLIDFKSKQNDQIGLSGDALSIEEIDLISVNNRFEQNLAKRSDHTLIYRQRENTGILYLNTNGDDRGWGATGGELVRLKGAPDLNATDLFVS